MDRPETHVDRPETHAIVIGAGMAGLMTARVLSSHYARVTILERDAIPAADTCRRGVPQGHHAHGLLARGREILEHYFPGITSELVADGALEGDLLGDALWFAYGSSLSQEPCGHNGLLMSRPVLEGHVRRRLMRLPNVEIVERCQALRPIGTRHGIAGVEIERSEPQTRTTLAADLVVDATGRNSRTPAWLTALGHEVPAEETVGVGITYTTRLYRRDPRQLYGKRVAVVRGGAPDWRFGVCLAQEQERWIVTVGGYFGDAPAPDQSSMLAFARSLPAPAIHEVVGDSEPLSPFRQFRFPESRRRRYERLATFPSGYLVMGDALCAFNPAYAQGMTVAMLQAQALEDCLSAGRDNLARRVFAKAATIIDTPWQIAVGNDLSHPRVEGPRTVVGRMLNWYVAQLHRAGEHEPDLSRAFIEVANLMSPPHALLRAGTMLKVLGYHTGLARRRTGGNEGRHLTARSLST